MLKSEDKRSQPIKGTGESISKAHPSMHGTNRTKKGDFSRLWGGLT